MLNKNDSNSYLQRLGYRNGLRMVVIGFCVLTAGILFLGALLAHGEIDLADGPLFTKINPPPTNIMLLLDDSGSMTFEILVRGAYDGEFPNPNYSSTEGFCYVFDDMGDGYNYTEPYRHLGEEGRKYWRSQFYEVNAVYYNPNVVYEPWPDYKNRTFLPADKQKPLVHPLKTMTLDLEGRSLRVGNLSIPWAHYFVRAADGTPYLVVINGKTKKNEYYTFQTDGADAPLDKITSVTLTNAPADIERNYDTDRQNFANWFTYHRRREFVAKAAISRTINNLDDVRVGILGINHTVIIPLKSVKAVIDGQFIDETDALIEKLYSYKSGGGTPLKEGLRAVGEYYKVNKANLLGQTGDAPPYPADGGDCQQSFTIIVTDGYYSDESYNPVGVGNADGDRANAAWGGGKKPYADDYGGTLADIAMYYYATDLSSTLTDQVPTNKWDGAPHQHMVTFAVAFGVSGTLNPQDYEDDRTNPNYLKYITKNEAPREYGDYVVWPKVTGDRQPQSVDDLWHATINGRGVFVHAGESHKLVEGLLQIIKDIKERQPTSAASVTVNGDWLFSKIGPDVLIFQGSYSYLDNEWSGDVKAYSLDQDTGAVILEPVVWSAAQKLQSKEWNARNILTYDGDQSGRLFVYDDLTDAQKQRLGAEAQQVVDFIRGKDPASKGNRLKMLGDIVHSSPIFNDGVVYVGANDGMLHAFAAGDGSELFAYVPNLVFDHIAALADSDYEHQFYVNQTPTVKKGDRLLGNTGTQTILVGGLGKGGKGYFALDITNPLAMSPFKVLWEFPRESALQADKDDMGYSYGSAAVVQSYSVNYPWVVIFGNGYSSRNGHSVLFIVDAKTGETIRAIQAGIGPDNGLSSPIAVDVDFDDVVDFVYAGDLHGNLWKFDLTSDKTTEWEVAYKNGAEGVPLFSAIDPHGNPQPITAKPDVMLHPKQHGLIVCFGTGKFLGEDDFSVTQTQTIYGIWDYGDRVFQPGSGWSPDDDTEFLGRFREPSGSAHLSNQPPKVKLLAQKASEAIVGSGEDQVTVRLVTDNRPVWQTMPDPDDDGQLPDLSDAVDNDAGWYLDLDVYSGERVVSDVLLRDGILIAIGFIPDQSYCGAGGESVFMELNAFTGGQLAGVQFDIHDDGSVNENDLVEIEEADGKKRLVPPSGMKLAGSIQPPAIIKLNEKAEKKYLSTSSGGVVEVTEKTAKTGIAYWMEIEH
jgi:type IV pilus assembly protein PilY1